MKITYTIDTQDPEQALELKQLQAAERMASVLWNLEQKLRSLVKYSEQASAAAQALNPGLIRASEILIELCQEEGISIENLNN